MTMALRYHNRCRQRQRAVKDNNQSSLLMISVRRTRWLRAASVPFDTHKSKLPYSVSGLLRQRKVSPVRGERSHYDRDIPARLSQTFGLCALGGQQLFAAASLCNWFLCLSILLALSAAAAAGMTARISRCLTAETLIPASCTAPPS